MTKGADNPFDILGVPRGSDVTTCKKAWQNLVKKNHPDKWETEDLKEQASQNLIKVNTAWQRLKKTAPKHNKTTVVKQKNIALNAFQTVWRVDANVAIKQFQASTPQRTATLQDGDIALKAWKQNTSSWKQNLPHILQPAAGKRHTPLAVFPQAVVISPQQHALFCFSLLENRFDHLTFKRHTNPTNTSLQQIWLVLPRISFHIQGKTITMNTHFGDGTSPVCFDIPQQGQHTIPLSSNICKSLGIKSAEIKVGMKSTLLGWETQTAAHTMPPPHDRNILWLYNV